MSQHVDILDERESLRSPLFGSLRVHAGVIALPFLFAFMRGSASRTLGRSEVARRRSRWHHSGGAHPDSIAARADQSGRKRHRVANPLRAREAAAEAGGREDPNAIALKSRNPQKKAAPQTTPQKYSPIKEPRPNQVYSSTGQAATSPMFSQAPGGGNVGSGSSSPFGNRFGYYEQLIRDKVARNWRSQDLDASVRNPVVVTFDILAEWEHSERPRHRSSGNFARRSIGAAGDSDVQSVSAAARSVRARRRHNRVCHSGYSDDKKDTFCFRSVVRGYSSPSLRIAS